MSNTIIKGCKIWDWEIALRSPHAIFLGPFFGCIAYLLDNIELTVLKKMVMDKKRGYNTVNGYGKRLYLKGKKKALPILGLQSYGRAFNINNE